MKQFLLAGAAIAFGLNVSAQLTSDSVSIGAGYTNQVFFSLRQGEQTTTTKAGWDLAFEIPGITSSIRINSVGGTQLWVYPNGDTASWNSVDTSGIQSWTSLLNSDTSWSVGAFNVNRDLNDAFDMGWGVYNLTTHQVVGDSIYIILDEAGAYHKLWVLALASGEYSFRISDLDGNNENQYDVAKGDFLNKNFAYFSIVNEEFIDREPASYDWDLLFAQYADPSIGGYPATGILMNRNTRALQLYPVADPETEAYDAAIDLHTEINTINYAWKSFNFTTFQWDILDSNVYFVETIEGAVWRLIMTGFSGSSSGIYHFDKEEVLPPDEEPEGLKERASTSLLDLYPNPANGYVNVVLNGGTNTETISILDINGRLVAKENVRGSGLQSIVFQMHSLQSGIYIVRVDGTNQTKRLIIQ